MKSSTTSPRFQSRKMASLFRPTMFNVTMKIAEEIFKKEKRNDRIIKHEEKYHNDIVLHAARMIVKKGLPFDAFESPEFKEMMGLLNEDFKDGISKEEIESRLP